MTLLPYNSSSIHQIFMNFCQDAEKLVINIKVLLLTPKNSGSYPPDLLGLKTPLLGLFLMFVQNVIMYVSIVVFYSVEFKFTYAIT